ncbi:MAG: Ig-like domain-containing protein, partial [Gemmatimonadales bacterium]
MNAFKLSALAVAGLPLVFACSDDNLTLPSEGAPARIEIVSGNAQQARVSSPLDSLIVKVSDSQGRPVAGVTVDFVLVEARGGSLSPTSGVTDAQGLAGTRITLGPQIGTLTGEARVHQDEGSAAIKEDFSATAVPADANILALVFGDNQSAPVGTELPDSLVVAVTDVFGNPISGITVTWAAQGGGTVSEESTVTGDNGQTFVTRILGPAAGDQQTVASAGQLVGSPVTFTHHATAGNANAVNIVSGNNQEAPAGSKLPQPLVVQLLDQGGNPIANQPVSWVVGDGGGSANPETSNTDANGQASTEWTLGPNPGTNTLNAVVSGLTPAAFRANGTGTGTPSTLAVITQPPSSVTSGATLSPAPVVQVRDGQGHDVALAGVEITVGLSQGNGQLNGTKTIATDGNGRAQFGDLSISGGSGTHKLIFAADGFRSATSSKIEVEKVATTITITGDDPDPSNSGQPVTVSVTVSSPGGTPSGDVEITASGSPSCTVAAPQGSCQVSPTASGDITATYKGSNTFASSSATTSHTVNAPPPPNQPPVAVADAYSTQFGQVLNVAAPGVLANDTDPEGGSLTAQLVDNPAQGIVTLN